MRAKLKTQLKKRLALLLAVLMVLSMGAMLDWSSFLLPKAEAATAGSYQVRVYMNNYDTDSDSDFQWCKVTGKNNNGTGSEGTIFSGSGDASGAWFDESTGSDYYSSAVTTSYFPLSFNAYWESHNCDKSGYGCDVYVQVYNNITGAWENVMSARMTSNENKTGKATYKTSCSSSCSAPSAYRLSALGGDSTIAVPTDGSSTNTTSAFTGGMVQDKYGVNMTGDATYSASTHTGVSFSNKKLSVNSNGNASQNYTITITASYNGLTSVTKNVTVQTFDYKVTFYDENGTTVLKNEQTVDYNSSATAPANPTKAYDSSKHYTFAGWTGDTPYQNITSGKQTRAIKASYTGTNHSYTSSVTNNATCTNAGSTKYTCSCGYNYTDNTKPAALGHNTSSTWTTDADQHWKVCTRCGTIMVAKENHSGGTATCTEKAKCSTCGVAYGSVNSSNHNWGSWTTVNNREERSCTRCGAKQYRLTATFNHMNASGSATTTSAQNSGSNSTQVITIPSTVPTSVSKNSKTYTLQGYSTGNNLTVVYNTSGTVTISANTPYYAVYKVPLTLSYNANGGSGAPASQTDNNGKANYNASTHSGTFTVSTTQPTRDGYTFKGWAKTNNATSATVMPGATYTADTLNTTLYAVWEARTDIQYKVRHHQQNAADNNYTLKETTTYNDGVLGGSITLADKAKTYEGFTYNHGELNGTTVTTANIAANGSLIVDLYYGHARCRHRHPERFRRRHDQIPADRIRFGDGQARLHVLRLDQLQHGGGRQRYRGEQPVLLYGERGRRVRYADGERDGEHEHGVCGQLLSDEHVRQLSLLADFNCLQYHRYHR